MVYRIILWCDFALAASRNGGLPFVYALVKQWKERNDLLRDRLAHRARRLLVLLLDLLENKDYIERHNLSHDLDDLSKLEYSAYPDRNKTVSYQEQVCVTNTTCCSPSKKCHWETHTKTVADEVYNSGKKTHVEEIEAVHADVKQTLLDFYELAAISEVLMDYLETLDADKDQGDRELVLMKPEAEFEKDSEDFFRAYGNDLFLPRKKECY